MDGRAALIGHKTLIAETVHLHLMPLCHQGGVHSTMAPKAYYRLTQICLSPSRPLDRWVPPSLRQVLLGSQRRERHLLYLLSSWRMLVDAVMVMWHLKFLEGIKPIVGLAQIFLFLKTLQVSAARVVKSHLPDPMKHLMTTRYIESNMQSLESAEWWYQMIQILSAVQNAYWRNVRDHHLTVTNLIVKGAMGLTTCRIISAWGMLYPHCHDCLMVSTQTFGHYSGQQLWYNEGVRYRQPVFRWWERVWLWGHGHWKWAPIHIL